MDAIQKLTYRAKANIPKAAAELERNGSMSAGNCLCRAFTASEFI